jgi:integrase
MSARRTRVEKHPGIYYRLGTDGKRRYEITYRDSDGRRRWQVVDGKLEDAAAALADVLGRKRKGERVAPSKVSLAELADAWLDGRSDLRPRTRALYRSALDLHVLPILGSRRVVDVSTDDVAALVARMRESGYAGWTIHGALTPLSGALNHAARRGLIAANPVTRLDRSERPKVGEKEKRELERDEIRRLLDACPPRYRPLLAFAVATGLRQGEALGLRWQDVDLSNRVLHVRWQWGRDHKLSEPKTKRARRDVVLAPSVVSMLRRHKAASPHSQAVDFVFASAAGTPLGHRNVVRRGLDKAMKAAGLDQNGQPKLTWHNLRDTAASVLIAGGASVVFVSRQLGHANVATTLKTYAHLFDAAEHGERARSAMDAALGNALETSGGDGRRHRPRVEDAEVPNLAEIQAGGDS